MTDNIYIKLLQVQAQLKAPKSQFNSFGKYRYRSCEDILEAVKPLLLKHGLTLTITDSVEHINDRFYIKALASIFDAENYIQTEAIAREPDEKKGMDAAQITGTASTYARKTALAGLFLLDDTKDADHTNQHNEDSAVPDNQNEIRDVIAEIKECTDLKELEAHYKANEEFVKQHKLGRYYSTRKKDLA